MTHDWEDRVEAVWADDALDDQARIDAIAALAAERDEDDPVALFERAGSYDSAGREAEAEALYRRALAAGLDADRRVQAVVQLASTLRNLGNLEESVELLAAEYARTDLGRMHDAVAAFYALALGSTGEERRAVSIALTALAPHLPRYTRSVRGYAAELLGPPRP